MAFKRWNLTYAMRDEERAAFIADEMAPAAASRAGEIVVNQLTIAASTGDEHDAAIRACKDRAVSVVVNRDFSEKLATCVL